MTFRRAAHVAWRRVGDETVLIHLKTKRIFVLNPSGGFFWHSLDGVRGTGEILDSTALSELPKNAQEELGDFWKELEGADLVEKSQPSDESADGVAQDYPLSNFVPPELIWQEQLRNFGQSCARDSGEMPICDASPTV